MRACRIHLVVAMHDSDLPTCLMRAGEVQLGLQFVKAQKRADGTGHTQIPAPKTARHTLRSLRALRELTRAEFAALPKVIRDARNNM